MSLFVAFAIAAGVMLFFKRTSLLQFLIAAGFGFYLARTGSAPEIADFISRITGAS